MGDQPTQENMLRVGNRASKPRHRASVACAACRERRTRCVVPVGEKECTACRDSQNECIIKHDDERRKPNSKAYVSSLKDRIAQLESMLEERESGSSALRSPQSMNSDQGLSKVHLDDGIAQNNDQNGHSIIPPLPAMDIPMVTTLDCEESYSPANSAHSTTSSNKSRMVSRLLSTRGHLSFDQLSGRLRYFGPTTNCHVYSELTAENQENNRQAVEQHRRTQRVLSTLPHETQEYLMSMFWQHYNSVIHVIHQGAFEEGLTAGHGQFYSPFLHICILSMGYRHADKHRPDIMKISLPGKESTLHREAKYMLDYELERPGGVTSIQALLLLGDLECGVGRDNLGWLISGMANRLCFEIGLHLDNSESGLEQREVEIGRMTLWACVIYDRYWALFLGRPTALKPDDLEVYRLAQQFERLGKLEPAGPAGSVEKQIYEGLLDLMELAGKITEVTEKTSRPNASLDQHVYFKMAALDRELDNWYSRLPTSLQWLPENTDSAPFSFFLLHQQYYAAKILLHRQFAHYDDPVSTASEQGSDNGDGLQVNDHFSSFSRVACTRSAQRVAQIFWQHRQKYDTKKIFVTGLQHAGTAAIALVAALASPKDQMSYDSNMKYLECLAASIEEMTETYQPAERMSAVLNAVLQELKSMRPYNPHKTTIPARRTSTADHNSDDNARTKRRQSTRPEIHRTRSQLSQPPLYISEQGRRHTTTDMPPPLSPFAARNEKGTSQPAASNDSFVLITNDSEVAEWSRFDAFGTFSGEESGYGNLMLRSGSPHNIRSTWMGAGTPSFSPAPGGNSGNAFSHDAALENHHVDSHDFGANLDFMSLLGGSGQDHGGLDQADVMHDLETSKSVSDAFTALADSSSSGQIADDSSTSATAGTTNLGHNRTDSMSKNGVTQRSGRSNTTPGTEAGFTQTMAGLDDIWKEMLKTNNGDTRMASAPPQ